MSTDFDSMPAIVTMKKKKKNNVVRFNYMTTVIHAIYAIYQVFVIESRQALYSPSQADGSSDIIFWSFYTLNLNSKQNKNSTNINRMS